MDKRTTVNGVIDVLVYVGLAFLTAGLGAIGGLGGAVLLVPALVLTGVPASEAAGLGLLSVAAGSVAAGGRQLAERSVNHRIGVTTELAATTGAIVGAIVSGMIADEVLVWFLAAVALLAAFSGGRRTGIRNPVDPEFTPDEVGERVGSLSGAYPLGPGVAPYSTRRLPLALSLMGAAGFVAGTTGASGGFIKTPATSEVMHVPTKVAASTTTFTIGITAAAALVVFALQGRIDVEAGSAVVLGSLAGGAVGAALQARLSPVWVRRGLSALLVVVAVVLVVSR